MVERSKQNLEPHDVESLVNILENWLALTCQMQDVREDLSLVFQEIYSLKHYSNDELSNNEINSKIQYVLKVLDRELPRLLNLETKIKNSIVQREIIEALQHKINGNETSIYEINFKKAQLYRDRDKSVDSNKGLMVKDNREKRLSPITMLPKLQNIGVKINNFWEKHYIQVSFLAGVGVISIYTLFLHFNNQRIYQNNYKLLSETEVIERNN